MGLSRHIGREVTTIFWHSSVQSQYHSGAPPLSYYAVISLGSVCRLSYDRFIFRIFKPVNLFSLSLCCHCSHSHFAASLFHCCTVTNVKALSLADILSNPQQVDECAADSSQLSHKGKLTPTGNRLFVYLPQFPTLFRWCAGVIMDLVTSLLGVVTGPTEHIFHQVNFQPGV